MHWRRLSLFWFKWGGFKRGENDFFSQKLNNTNHRLEISTYFVYIMYTIW